MFAVYIMASRRNGTLDTGHTHDLRVRVQQHKAHHFPNAFTAKYGCILLVWYEQPETRESALRRERRIKTWVREWRLALIERINPGWHHLSLHLERNKEHARTLDDYAFLDPPQKSLDPRFRGSERSG